MALVGVGVQVIPLMGAAVFLPSAMATALRIHPPSSSERKIGKVINPRQINNFNYS